MKDRSAHSERRSTTGAKRTATWQQEFQKERGAFRNVFEHAAIGIGLVDLEGRFLTVNQSLCRIIGYSEEELLAINAQSIIHPDDQKDGESWGTRMLVGEIDHYHTEQRVLHKQGPIVWVQLSASIVRDDAGNPCYFIGQLQDITARKSAQEESARRLRHMERLTQTVSRILHTLETVPDDAMYSSVLQIALESFQSKSGWFLRFFCDKVLVGVYASRSGTEDVRYLVENQCELWNRAPSEGVVVAENGPRSMGPGKLLSRSLVAPISHHGVSLGLFHIADSETDYDADDRDLLARIAEIIAPVLSARLKRDKLTPREAEVMDLIVSGKTQKQIAVELGISVQTAAKHRATMLVKLKVRNDVELVHLALQMQRLST